MREKVGKSRNTVFFQWFGAPEGRKVGSLKRRVRSQLARWEMKNCTFPSQNVQNTSVSDDFWKLRCGKSARRCGTKHISKSKCTKRLSVGRLLEVETWKKCTPLWREAHFQVKMYKTLQRRTTFGSCDVKSARRCDAKHISKSKCTKHNMVGALLEVEMSKKCTPMWREAHLEVKMLKAQGVRTTFGSSDLEKVHAVVARSTFWSQNVKKTRGSDHFWRLRCRFASLHYTTSHYTTLHYTTLQDITLHYTPVHYITLRYTPVPSTTLNYTTPHYITLHYPTPHYITLHYTTLHSTTLHYTILHYLPLHFTTSHYTTLHYTTNTTTTTQLHSTTLHYTPLHSTTLHYTKLHYTTLHYTTLHYFPPHSTALHYTTLHYILPHSTTPHYITLDDITLNDTAPQIDR